MGLLESSARPMPKGSAARPDELFERQCMPQSYFGSTRSIASCCFPSWFRSKALLPAVINVLHIHSSASDAIAG